MPARTATRLPNQDAVVGGRGVGAGRSHTGPEGFRAVTPVLCGAVAAR